MNYIQSKKFMFENANISIHDEEEKKKIYPTDTDKMDELEELIKVEINREFHILLQKDKFDDSDSSKVREFIKEYIKNNKYFFQRAEDYELFVDMIVNDIFGLGVLEGYINNPEIQEIWALGPKKIYIDKLGKRELSPLKFKNDKIIVAMINKILAPINRKADESTPLVDARLADGSRVTITMPPISVSNGPEIVIRKFKKDKFTLDNYVEIGSANRKMADFLAASVRWGANILVVGGTSSGKTTLLNALTNEIPRDFGEEHVITIEDSAELIVGNPFLQSWETKNNNSEGRGEIDSSRLVKHALRNSPDRIILGEIRDKVSYDVLQAAITGHKGTMSTIHADNAAKAVDRFSTLAGSAGIISAEDARKLFADAFDLLVVLERMKHPVTGKYCRVITQICHVVGVGQVAAEKLGVKSVDNPTHVYLQDIYKLDKKKFVFKTTGYIPKELVDKANVENRPYDLNLFKIEKKKGDC